MQPFPDIPEAAACFISHLSLASRQGHLCLRIDEGKVKPRPSEIWRTPEDMSWNEDTLQYLEALILEGSKLLPVVLITNMELNQDTPSTPLYQQGNRYYLQKFWVYETLFIDLFKTFQQAKPSLSVEMSAVHGNIKQLEQEKKLLPEQAEAVIKACKNCLTLVCGGPGTGKTYTAAYIIQTLWHGLAADQKKDFKILLAAPAGKAASQLQKSLSKVLDSLEGMKPPIAKTLHAMLGITRHHKTVDTAYLSADLILVDECSMIDIKVMIELLKSVKPKARLILLGDPYQLPPVESGGIFSDIISTLDQMDSPLKPVLLKTCLRSELKGILHLAEGVKSGDTSRILEGITNPGHLPGVNFFPLGPSELKKNLGWIIEQASQFYHYADENTYSPEALISLFNRFRILTPLRRGPFGVDSLNIQIHENLTQKTKGQKQFCTPIMIVSNHKGLNLFNGETGLLMTEKNNLDPYSFQRGDYAVFSDPTNPSHKVIPAALLPRFELAYCLSIHKSQGSEFNHVLLILPEGSEIFGREAFYTAITRAKKQLDILSNINTIKETIERCSLRISGVLERNITQAELAPEGLAKPGKSQPKGKAPERGDTKKITTQGNLILLL